jgi:lipopolysaccharide/colanic/teichoic acid biosynthesis glycosyltransferase
MSATLFPNGIPVQKRLFDLILTLIGGVVISPLIGLIALLVGLFHGWPVIFAHERPGYRAATFTLYKFRTMSERRDAAGDLLPDTQRLTAFGRFLRSTSLDELPELWNVLRGEMSLVGPRPLLMQYLGRYSSEQARRHDVLPGITGWAQVNGRNNVSWRAKFELDVWYVDHWSLWLDARILALTLWKVVKRENINEPGNATAREFMGNEEI